MLILYPPTDGFAPLGAAAAVKTNRKRIPSGDHFLAKDVSIQTLLYFVVIRPRATSGSRKQEQADMSVCTVIEGAPSHLRRQ